MTEWIKKNVEWVFSGVGIFFVTILGNFAKYLINWRKDRKEHKQQEEAFQNQKDRLALEQEQLRLKVRPSLVVSNPMINNATHTIMIELVNYGETAILNRIARLPNGWEQVRSNYPYRLEKGCNVRLSFRMLGARNMDIDTFSFDIELEDDFENQYTARVIIDHNGHRVDLISL